MRWKRGNNRRRRDVVSLDEIREAAAEKGRPRPADGGDGVTGVRPLPVPHAYRSVRLHSRPHIDLQRVSAALCRR
ncbi:putative leader peptide [Streptomyces sp. NPDC001851]|uniref:putative leader peptide n=1 Tax=Streptomyces sp. NPDC001851 TaxID=3154529 RepID=UPI00332336FA